MPAKFKVTFWNVPTSPFAASKILNTQIPSAGPVNPENGFSGAKFPVKGAAPEAIGVPPAIKTVLVKLSPPPPLRLLRVTIDQLGEMIPINKSPV